MTRTQASRRRAPAGFTLVELVVVIAILGILAAVALPRFTSLQKEARISKMQAVAGAVRAAAAQVKATAIVRGQTCAIGPGSNPPPVALEGTAIATAYCYPDASASGIVSAANLSGSNDGLVFAYPNTITAVISQADGAGGAMANCSVTYNSPSAADGQPTVALVTSGC